MPRHAVVALLLFGAACSSGNHSPTPSPARLPQPDVRHIGTVSLDVARRRFRPTDLALMSSFRTTVPTSVPPTAVVNFSVFDSVRSRNGVAYLDRTASGTVAGHLLYANLGPSNTGLRVLCLRNGRQVDCAPHARVWDAEIPPNRVMIAPINIGAVVGDRIDVLRLIDGEVSRPEPYSSDEYGYVVRRGAPPRGTLGPRHVKVLGGCDIAPLVTSDRPSATYRRPRVQRRGARLFLDVETCPSNQDEIVQLVAVADRYRVVTLRERLWHGPVRLNGSTLVVSLPVTAQTDIHELQVVLLNLSSTHPATMFSPAVTVA